MYKFNVILTDENYFEFNLFNQTKTEYGKKQMQGIRVIFSLLFVVGAVIGAFSVGVEDFWLPLAIGAVCIILFQLLFKSFLKSTLQKQIVGMKKHGKMPYESQYVLEFLDETFIEQTEKVKIESKYTQIERIYYNKNKSIYLYENNLMAIIIPITCFAFEQDLKEFLGFIATKCNKTVIVVE